MVSAAIFSVSHQKLFECGLEILLIPKVVSIYGIEYHFTIKGGLLNLISNQYVRLNPDLNVNIHHLAVSNTFGTVSFSSGKHNYFLAQGPD